MDSRPIGVFDSGLGGLTAVKRLRALLPSEKIIFLGDTARIPYGSRDPETVRTFARRDIAFLRAQGVKLIAAACGTVSSNSRPEDLEGLDLPFTGLLTPAAEAAAKATRNGKVGLLATAATVASGKFAEALKEADPRLELIPEACPEFVDLIESGKDGRSPAMRRAVREHVRPLLEAGADTVILGCTHYPLIRGLIRREAGEDVVLIDSGAVEAERIASLLREADALAPEGAEGGCLFCLTAEKDRFCELGGLFLGEDVADRARRISPADFENPRRIF